MMTMAISKISARRIWPWLAALTVFLLGPANAHATNAKLIKKCMEIKKAGLYILKSDLTGSSSGCLKISGSNVTLDGNRHTINGVGNGIGLLITGSSVFFNHLTVQSFNIGIEVDGANAFGDTFFADNNVDTGLFLNGSSGGKFNAFDADANGNANVHLKGASGNVFLFGNTSGGKFGFWYDSSNNNTAQQLGASGCSIAAIYLGCSPTGPGGQCSGNSTGNKFAESGTSSCPIGMAIDAGSLGNVITSLSANTSQDGNASCGTNVWFNNNITSADQTCEN